MCNPPFPIFDPAQPFSPPFLPFLSCHGLPTPSPVVFPLFSSQVLPLSFLLFLTPPIVHTHCLLLVLFWLPSTIFFTPISIVEPLLGAHTSPFSSVPVDNRRLLADSGNNQDLLQQLLNCTNHSTDWWCYLHSSMDVHVWSGILVLPKHSLWLYKKRLYVEMCLHNVSRCRHTALHTFSCTNVHAWLILLWMLLEIKSPL